MEKETTKIKHLENKFIVTRYELIVSCEPHELQFYQYLKLYAINKHSAFPCKKTIKKDLGWDEKKIRYWVKKMEKKGRLKYTAGLGRKPSVYDITWYDEVNLKGEKNQRGEISPLRGEKNHPSEGRKITPVTINNITNNNITNNSKAKALQTNEKEINDLISLFKEVNPSYQQLFKNKTQRSALERLIEQHSQEKIKWVIKVISKTNKTKFAPVICTPLQLESKLGQLIAFMQKEKSEKINIEI